MIIGINEYTYIYILIDPLNNEVRYVGKSNDPKKRYLAHNNKSKDKNTHKRNWINKLRLKGLYPEMEVIDKVLKSEWHYWEKWWIMYFKFIGANLINQTFGGDGLTFGNQTSFRKGCKPTFTGADLTEEQRDKIRKAMLGKPVSEETRKKLSKANKGKIGKPHTKETIEIIKHTFFKKGHVPWHKGTKGVYKSSRKGVPLSDSIKLKISNTLKGRATKPTKKVSQFDKENKLINTFSSLKEASDYTSVNYNCIANAVTGRAKTAGGYIWQ
jgi:predicted GIY-YIG superfamily endonuclease